MKAAAEPADSWASRPSDQSQKVKQLFVGKAIPNQAVPRAAANGAVLQGAKLLSGGKSIQYQAALRDRQCCSAGAKLLFGGKEIQNHTIPKVYGAIEPTAVFVPLKEVLKDEETFNTITTEVFGPVQVCMHCVLLNL